MFSSSYSSMMKFLRCPDQWLREPKQPPTPAMAFGSDVHALRAALLTGKAVESVKIQSVGREAEALALAEAGRLPKADDLLSVDGSGIPKRHQVQMYGKTMGEIDIAPGYRLTWVEDAIELAPDGESVLTLDWKTGRPDEDAHHLQGACYALAAMTCYPGFARYVFRPVYLGFPDADYSLEYAPADVPELTGYLLELMKRMEAVKKADRAEPTINKYCASCGLKEKCSAFSKAVTVVPKRETYPMETPVQIVRAREELANIRKCVEALEEIADDRLKALCAAAPVVVGDQEWYLKEIPSRYEYDPEGVEAALVAHEIDPLAYFRPDRTELKKLEKLAPAAFAAVQAHERVKSTSTKLYSRRARGVIDVTPKELPAPSNPSERPTGQADGSKPAPSEVPTSRAGSGVVAPDAATGKAEGDAPENSSRAPAQEAAASAGSTSGPAGPSPSGRKEMPYIHVGAGKHPGDVVTFLDGERVERGEAISVKFRPPLDGEPYAIVRVGSVEHQVPASAITLVERPAGTPPSKIRTRRPVPIHSCGRKCRYMSSRRPVAYCPACNVDFSTDGSPLPPRLQEKASGEADRKSELISQIKLKVAPLVEEDWRRFCRDACVTFTWGPSFLDACTMEELEQIFAAAERI